MLMSSKKNFIRIFSAIFISVVSLEAFAVFFIRYYSERFELFKVDAFLIDKSSIIKVVKIFDPQLGWRFKFDTEYGERKRSKKFSQTKMYVFGDSFAFGDEVSDTQTWQEQLAATQQQNILNFGISAYGPDQSLLYFKKIAPQLPKSSVVSLVVTTENINRIVNIYRKFYFSNTGMPLTKPMFNLTENGVTLIENPIDSLENLHKLENKEFVKNLAKIDFWGKARNKNRISFLRPNFLNFFTKDFWLNFLSVQTTSETGAPLAIDLWGDKDAEKLFQFILKEFIELAKMKNAKPMVIILPYKNDIVGAENINQKGRLFFNNFCHIENIDCFDGIKALTEVIKEKAIDTDSLWQKGGHLSPLGNKLIADRLNQLLTQNKQK